MADAAAAGAAAPAEKRRRDDDDGAAEAAAAAAPPSDDGGAGPAKRARRELPSRRAKTEGTRRRRRRRDSSDFDEEQEAGDGEAAAAARAAVREGCLLLGTSDDVWRYLLGFLSADDVLGSMPLVSTGLRARIELDDSFWRRRCVRELGVSPRARVSRHGSWLGRFKHEVFSRCCCFCARRGARGGVTLVAYHPRPSLRTCARCLLQRRARVEEWADALLERYFLAVGGPPATVWDVATSGPPHTNGAGRPSSYFMFLTPGYLRRSLVTQGLQYAGFLLDAAVDRLQVRLNEGRPHPMAQPGLSNKALVYLGKLSARRLGVAWPRPVPPSRRRAAAHVRIQAEMLRSHRVTIPWSDRGRKELEACAALVARRSLGVEEAALRVARADAAGRTLESRGLVWARAAARALTRPSPAFWRWFDPASMPPPGAEALYDRAEPPPSEAEILGALDPYLRFEEVLRRELLRSARRLREEAGFDHEAVAAAAAAAAAAARAPEVLPIAVPDMKRLLGYRPQGNGRGGLDALPVPVPRAPPAPAPVPTLVDMLERHAHDALRRRLPPASAPPRPGTAELAQEVCRVAERALVAVRGGRARTRRRQ